MMIMIFKFIIQIISIIISMILAIVAEILIIDNTVAFFNALLHKDFYSGSISRWLKLIICAILAIGQVAFLVAWAWT